MKKMLMWLSPIPFIIIAFGWAFSGEKTETDHTSYYVGTGTVKSDVTLKGGQNNEYSIIGVDVKVTTDGTDKNIRYSINESVNKASMDAVALFEESALADPIWFPALETDLGTIKGSDLKENGWDENSNNTAIENDVWYENRGESVEHVYDVVSYEFDKYKDDLINLDKEANQYEAKSSVNYTHSEYNWVQEKAIAEIYLLNTYGKCADLEATDFDTVIAAYAAEKSSLAKPNTATGGVSANAGLYVAAGLTTAVAACA